MDGAGTTCVGGQWPPGTITVAQHDGVAVPDVPAAELDALDERALIAACLAGQREAFDHIVVRHRRAVYQLCYRFVGNHEDATDLAQDVFLRAYRALRNFKGDAAFGTWLYRIAVNLCLNKVSSRAPRTEAIDERSGLSTREPDAMSQLMSAERAGQVRAAIAKLPPRQRATLILRVYQDLPHQEIARLLGSSAGAVKANFFHALNNLRRLLGEDEL
jgi:RNA polymerase sigma-70 factor (ECF subfamily)